MDSHHRELYQIARQLRQLANEGHGGSEARLVTTLQEQSHTLQKIAASMAKDLPRRKFPRIPVVSYLALVKLVYDLLSSIAL